MLDIINVNIKLLYLNSKVPTKAHPDDACYDLFSVQDACIAPQERALVRLGIAMDMPRGYCFMIYDKSGKALKEGRTVLGGVIDCGYQDEIKTIIFNSSIVSPIIISDGMAVAQGKFEKVIDANFIKVDNFSNFSDRGIKGFGSTDLEELTIRSKVGSFVYFTNISDGQKYQGIIQKWEGNVAVILRGQVGNITTKVLVSNNNCIITESTT